MGAKLVLLLVLGIALSASSRATSEEPAQSNDANNNNNDQARYQNITQSGDLEPRSKSPVRFINTNLKRQQQQHLANTPPPPPPPRNVGGSSNTTRINKRGVAGRSDQHAQINKMFEPSDTRVPFWNIAHMINSIDQIEPSLSAGANGIETDISFNSMGVPVEVYHGFPCDCGRHCHHREDFVAFVKHLAKISLPAPGVGSTSKLQLVLFDLKLKELKDPRQKETAGKLIAKTLSEHYFSKYQAAVGHRSGPTQQASLVRPALRFIVSINHASDIPLVRAILRHMEENRLDLMRKHVGFDVGMNDDLNEISDAWDSLRGATFNIWQGDGLTNCANVIRGHERLKKAIEVRNKQGHFRKVYYWTADIMYHIRSVLRFGIDALLTNKPERVLQVLREPEFQARYRPATHYDDPFEQYWIRPLASGLAPPTIGEAVETVQNIRHTSSEFIKTIPDGLSAVLKKVHSSISSSIRSD